MRSNVKILISAGLFSIAASAASLSHADTLTTDSGAPVGDNQNSQTAGQDGPVLLQDWRLVEKLARFDRERIPERVVHARGAGAYGVFESDGNVNDFTKASFLNSKGKQTPVFVRFSTVIHSKGSPEIARDPRGFSVKFYTDQGNYDLVGNNLPVFFIRDAIKFPDMVHSLKPSPITNKQEPARFFDFFSQTPESTQMLTWVYSDNGTPASFRKMDGFSVHAFKWINAEGDVRYVKYHWKSMQGIENLDAAQAAAVVAKTWTNLTDDLYQEVNAGNFPQWELYVQMLDPEDMDKFDFNVLDATKDWPENLIPSMKIGKLTLNRMPTNFFQETEQSAYSPGVVVPGIEPSEDKLLQGRIFSYADTQRHRIGANYTQLPVNHAKVEVNNYSQDGAMNMGNTKGTFNYEPNGDRKAFTDDAAVKPTETPIGTMAVQEKIAKTQNFAQAGDLYRSFSEQDKTNLIANLAGDLGKVKDQKVVTTMIGYFYQADKDYGTRIAKALNVDISAIERMLVASR